MKKKIPSKSLDQLVSKYSKNEEFKIAYDERRFYLQVAHMIRDLRETCRLERELVRICHILTIDKL